MAITRVMRDRLAARILGAAVSAGLTIPPQTLGSGATNGTAINGTTWAERVHYELVTGAVSGTSPTLDVVIQESANGTTGWATVATLTQVVAANQTQRGSVDFTGPYLRAVGTVGGTSTPTVIASVLLQSEIAPPLLPGGVYVGLYSSITPAGLDTTLADMTFPAASVAARQAVSAWNAPYNMLNDDRVADSPLLTFRPTSSADESTVAGWYVADASASGNLLEWGSFAAPIQLLDEDYAVNVVFRPTLDPDSTWNASIYFNG